MKITVAVENSVAFPFNPGIHPGILGEHGLALVVEREGKKWLYDTGRGRALLLNLKTLNIAPDEINGVVLSHAHLDHFGSLMVFLKARTKPVDVYMHRKAFAKRYTRIGDGYRSVGLPWSEEELTDAGARLHLNTDPVCLAPGLWLTGGVARDNCFEQVEKKFFIDGENGEKQHDDILDDQALLVETDKGVVVLTGCAHAGVCNILEAVKKIFPGQRIRAALGGLHLEGAPEARLQATARYLKKQIMDTVAAGHCTGFEACCLLAGELPGVFSPMNAGMVMEFD